MFRDVLGLPVQTSIDQQAILNVGETQLLELFGRLGPGKSNNSPPSIAFEVDDLDAAITSLLAADITLVGDVGEWQGHRWQYFSSPDGYLFSVKITAPKH